MPTSPQPPKEIRSPEDLNRVFEFIGQATDDFRNDRERPYDGQPHTDLGKRGQTEVKGITFRDLRDCFIMGALAASFHNVANLPDAHFCDKVRDGTWCANDLYALDWNRMDPIAVAQSMACEVEKMMGIYPNVPKLTFEEPTNAKG